ncbi:helix-turn-helix domain-containing protein [Streptomyces melanosporofaciens]
MPPATSQKTYLTTAEVAARYRTTAGTVRYWRHIGYGPKGIKRGRRVLYDSQELDRWDTEAHEDNGDAGPCTSDAANGTPSLTTSNQ